MSYAHDDDTPVGFAAALQVFATTTLSLWAVLWFLGYPFGVGAAIAAPIAGLVSGLSVLVTSS